MLAWLQARGSQTADELRGHLAHYQRVYVTVDTVQRDLREMKKAGIIQRVYRSPHGYIWYVV